MASPLDGLIKKQVAKGFNGQLKKGTIRHYAYTQDGRGDQHVSGFTDYPFQGIRENFNARFRVQALIPETDVKILVLLGSTKVTPERNDAVNINGAWHKVRQILEIDPAGASAQLQAYQIPQADA